MKHLVLWLTALLFTISTLQAQSKKVLASMLSRDLEAYKKHTLALNFDSSLQFMPPKTFEMIPFDSLKTTMLKALDNEYMKIQMASFQFDSKRKPKIKKAGVYSWALVPYTGSMRMVFKGEEPFRAIVIPVMKSQFGEKYVTMENDSTMLIALKNKKLIAFKAPDSPIWHMIEDKRFDTGPGNEAERLFVNSVLPEEVLKALGGQ